MEIEKVLADEAQALFEQEEAMKKRLEELRKARKNAEKATWQENLVLISSNADERRRWALQIEKDVQEQKTIKKQQLSANFLNGPTRPPSVMLAKLIIKAAVQAKIQLPKQVLLDLDKSGLPAKYAELCEAEMDKE